MVEISDPNSLAKKYYPLADLAKRWNLETAELLNYAIEGVIQVAIEEFRWEKAGEVCSAVFDEWDGEDYPSWAVFVVPDVLKRLAADHEILVSGGMKIGSWGLQPVFFPQRRLTVNDLIVLPQFLNTIPSATDKQSDFFGDQHLALRSRKTLLKQIAALAVLLSKQNKSFAWGGKPNSSGISLAIDQALAQWPAEKWGNLEKDFFSKSKINESISEGLELIGFKEDKPTL